MDKTVSPDHYHNSTAYVAVRFFLDLVPVYPVYVILFQARGLSFVEISLLMAIWNGVVVALELPTGVLADKWGRKKSVFAAMLLKAAGFGVWLLRPDFTGFAIGFALWGAQEALCSGTLDALLFDALKARRQEERFEAVAGAGAMASGTAIVLAMVLGGYLYSRNVNFVLLLSGAAMLPAALAVALMTEIPQKADINTGSSRQNQESDEKAKPQAAWWKELHTAFRTIFKQEGIIPLLVFGSLVYASYGVMEEYDTVLKRLILSDSI